MELPHAAFADFTPVQDRQIILGTQNQQQDTPVTIIQDTIVEQENFFANLGLAVVDHQVEIQPARATIDIIDDDREIII